MSDQSNKSSPMVRNIRMDFIKGMLTEDEISRDPVKQFSEWLEFEFKTNQLANAMVLSTVGADGMPDSRVMLLRDVAKEGLTFFTNYDSKKGKDLERNPHASLLFFWPENERQVRISGKISRLPPAESDVYFASRPFESRVGAVVSAQSSVVESRIKMDEAYEQALKKFGGKSIPRPRNWGGYLLAPVLFEYWQGRASRMHDRIRYEKKGRGWVISRLMP